jgi:hypothetical protein
MGENYPTIVKSWRVNWEWVGPMFSNIRRKAKRKSSSGSGVKSGAAWNDETETL